MSLAYLQNPQPHDFTALTLLCDEVEVKLYERAPGGGLYVPRAYANFAYKDTRAVMGEPMRALPPIRLRDEQIPAVEAVEQALREGGGEARGAILFAPCGKGKTVMGLEIARRMGRKTLVLVHKTFLVEQWVDRARAFLPDAKIGFWQRDQLPSEDDEIVIGMVQSICNPRREYDRSVYEQFGMILADETHRYAAPMWQDAIKAFPAAYRVGLTATPERKDNMQAVFLLHIGPIVYRMQGHTRAPTIFKIETGAQIEMPKTNRNGTENTSAIVTRISEVASRTASIVDYALRAVVTGRKVLILTERVKHAQQMLNAVTARLPDGMSASLYIGATTEEQRRAASECDVIIGSYAMAQEGLDIPHLDTLLLATPKTSVTQSIGRILRDAPDKKDPVVLDFVDSEIDICGAYWGARRRLYLSLGYLVRHT